MSSDRLSSVSEELSPISSVSTQSAPEANRNHLAFDFEMEQKKLRSSLSPVSSIGSLYEECFEELDRKELKALKKINVGSLEDYRNKAQSTIVLGSSITCLGILQERESIEENGRSLVDYRKEVDSEKIRLISPTALSILEDEKLEQFFDEQPSKQLIKPKAEKVVKNDKCCAIS